VPLRVGYLRLRWCSMAWTAKRRPKPAAWTVRPCGTGCTVTTPRDWPDFAISNHQVADQNSRRGSRPNWPRLSRPAPTPLCTGSCVGGGSICATNCSGASVSRSHERSVGKVLAKLGTRKLSVRPRHPQADEEAQETFKKTSPRQSRRKSPTAPKASRSKSGSRGYEDGLSRYFGGPESKRWSCHYAND
jgi:hypothetical protein